MKSISTPGRTISSVQIEAPIIKRTQGISKRFSFVVKLKMCFLSDFYAQTKTQV